LEILSIDDQINITDKMIKEHPNLSNPLELHRRILEAQRGVMESPKKGTNINWVNNSIIEKLQHNAIKSGQPIVNFIDSSIFDLNTLLHTIEQVIEIFIEKGIKVDWLRKFLDKVKSAETNILNLVDAVLKGDADYLKRHGRKFRVSPALILFIINSSIQPCLVEIAKRVDESFLERWWQASCPICGRIPTVARLKDRKRHLTCTLCGAIYLADLFLCVNCGNVDPYTLKFIVPEGCPELRIDFCEKCKYYLKVIDENKLKNPIPRGLEDIMTIDLDFVAKGFGLSKD